MSVRNILVVWDDIVIMAFGDTVGGLSQYDAIFRLFILSQRVSRYCGFKPLNGEQDATCRLHVVSRVVLVGTTHLDGAVITCLVALRVGGMSKLCM